MNVTVVENGLTEMREKVFQLMKGTTFMAVVFNEVITCKSASECHILQCTCTCIYVAF